MFIKKKGLIGAALIAAVSMFNACGDDASSEPDNFDLDSSSSISTDSANGSSDSGSSDSSDSQQGSESSGSSSSLQDSASTIQSSSSISEESRLPKVEDQDGPHYRSYAINSITEKDGFTIVDYDRQFCRATTFNSGGISSTYQWDSESNGYSILVVKKNDNGLYISRHGTLDMKYIYDFIEENQDTTALADLSFYTGTSENIYGEWTYQPKDTSTPREGEAIILTQDSVHFLTYINPETNYTTPNELYFLFGDIFGSGIYYEISDNFHAGYNILGDIPTRGIKLTQSDSSIFIDMNGLKLEFLVKKKYTKMTTAIQHIIRSEDNRCSYTNYTQELMQSEYCSSTYKNYIHISGYNTQNEIYRLEDYGFESAYKDCFKEMIKDNPAWEKKTN
ncbi:MAG: hypothetical protein J6W22_06580 [Fibrobacter sp.]|nr:hypothetical protein [Fibrobacter sp.]